MGLVWDHMWCPSLFQRLAARKAMTCSIAGIFLLPTRLLFGTTFGPICGLIFGSILGPYLGPHLDPYLGSYLGHIWPHTEPIIWFHTMLHFVGRSHVGFLGALGRIGTPKDLGRTRWGSRPTGPPHAPERGLVVFGKLVARLR